MKVFIGLKAPHGDASFEHAADWLAETVQGCGHEPFVAALEIARRGLAPCEFMPFVRDEIRRSQLFVLLYHPELRGGLIEMGIAYAAGIPIWLLTRNGKTVSSSAQGVADQVIGYNQLTDLKATLVDAFRKFAPSV